MAALMTSSQLLKEFKCLNLDLAYLQYLTKSTLLANCCHKLSTGWLSGTSLPTTTRELKPATQQLLQAFRKNLEQKGEIIVSEASNGGGTDLRVAKISFQAHAAHLMQVWHLTLYAAMVVLNAPAN
jgi:UDP-N-acetylmuramyl tripeptide synthase